jgi:hypothetical protein
MSILRGVAYDEAAHAAARVVLDPPFGFVGPFKQDDYLSRQGAVIGCWIDIQDGASLLQWEDEIMSTRGGVSTA